jgi:hypothetical protein
MAGFFVSGRWQAQEVWERDEGGSFQRQESRFRELLHWLGGDRSTRVCPGDLDAPCPPLDLLPRCGRERLR